MVRYTLTRCVFVVDVTRGVALWKEYSCYIARKKGKERKKD